MKIMQSYDANSTSNSIVCTCFNVSCMSPSTPTKNRYPGKCLLLHTSRVPHTLK